MIINGKEYTQTNDSRIFLDKELRPICVENKDFWKYVNEKGVDKSVIIGLSIENRRKFFLKWRYGLENPDANEEIEQTMKTIKHQSSLDQKNTFDDYCENIKGQIGLGPIKMPTPIKQPDWQQ